MKIVDLNVLLYVVNENASHHKALLSWWESAVNGDESVGLPWVVLLGFLRITTNKRIFPNPLKPDTDIDKINARLSLDTTCLVREKEEHWEILRTLSL